MNLYAVSPARIGLPGQGARNAAFAPAMNKLAQSQDSVHFGHRSKPVQKTAKYGFFDPNLPDHQGIRITDSTGETKDYLIATGEGEAERFNDKFDLYYLYQNQGNHMLNLAGEILRDERQIAPGISWPEWISYKLYADSSTKWNPIRPE